MFIKYLSLKYSEFILAFQLQFGTYEPESEHFQWEKENAIPMSSFPDKYTFYIFTTAGPCL